MSAAAVSLSSVGARAVLTVSELETGAAPPWVCIPPALASRSQRWLHWEAGLNPVQVLRCGRERSFHLFLGQFYFAFESRQEGYSFLLKDGSHPPPAPHEKMDTAGLVWLSG